MSFNKEICPLNISNYSSLVSADPYHFFGSHQINSNCTAIDITNDHYPIDDHYLHNETAIALPQVNIVDSISKNEENVKNQQFYNDLLVNTISYGMTGFAIAFSVAAIYKCPYIVATALTINMFKSNLPCGNFLSEVSNIALSICMGNAQFKAFGIASGKIAMTLFSIFSKPINELMINEVMDHGLKIIDNSSSFQIGDIQKFSTFGNDLVKRGSKAILKGWVISSSAIASFGVDITRDFYINSSTYLQYEGDAILKQLTNLANKNLIKHVICGALFPLYFKEISHGFGMKICRQLLHGMVQSFRSEGIEGLYSNI